MRRMLLLFAALTIVPAGMQAQEETTNVTIKIILVDKDLNQKPAPHVAVQLTNPVAPDAAPAILKTNLDGTAEIQLKQGKYHLASSEAVEFQGYRFTWDLDVTVSGSTQVIELSNDNARISEVSAAAPARKIDELTALFQRFQNSVVTVWSEIGHGTGFVVDISGLILTNQHVVGPSELISVQFDATRKVAAKLLAFDPERDVAVLWANLAAFPEAIAAPIAQAGGGHDILAVGERVFTIGSPLNQRKILTSGIASKIEERVIISDININHGNSGGPLFNSIGEVVGITTFFDPGLPNGPGISGIIRIEQTLPLLQQAKRKMRDSSVPEARLLPVEPTDSYPLDSLKELIHVEKFESKPYLFSEAGYDVALITPVLKYRIRESATLRAAKEKGKRNQKRESAVKNTFEPLQDMKAWEEYVGQYQPVLQIEAAPQLRETFWSAFGRGMAASRGGYIGPAHLKYKTDFYRMRLLCGTKEIEPIHPAKVASVLNVHNAFVNVSDATYTGFYVYPADAISPSCGKVLLELYSEKEPDKPAVKELDSKTIQHVWQDFQPYLNARK